MILADTSVWIDHLRSGNASLAESLQAGNVLVHPFIIGELACGYLEPRREILRMLQDLPGSRIATHQEAMYFIEANGLMGRGIGYVDLHLLAAVSLTAPARLWTLDSRLGAVASDLGLAA